MRAAKTALYAEALSAVPGLGVAAAPIAASVEAPQGLRIRNGIDAATGTSAGQMAGGVLGGGLGALLGMEASRRLHGKIPATVIKALTRRHVLAGLIGGGLTGASVGGLLGNSWMLHARSPTEYKFGSEKRASYQEGYQAAMKLAAGEDGGAPPAQSSWRDYLPLAGAAAGGLGAYAYMRHPEKAVSPYLQKLRTLARDGYTRPVNLSDSPIYPLIRNTIKRNRSDGTYTMPWYSKALARVVHGDGAMPILGHKDVPKFYPKGVDPKVRPKGLVVDDDFLGSTKGSLPHKGHDRWMHEGPKNTRRFVTGLEASKDTELQFLEKHMPGLSPERVDVAKLLAKTRGTDEQRVEQLHGMLKEIRKSKGYDDIMLKPVDGFQSDGLFPRARKLKKQWAAYTTAMKNPKLKAQYEAALKSSRDPNKDPAEFVNFLKDNDLYEGHALRQGLDNPKALMGQRFMPGYQGELRVHLVNGELMPHGTLPRHWYAQSPLETLMQMRHTGKAHDLAREVARRMPAKARNGVYGMDIGMFKDPHTGKIVPKIVEMNPSSGGSQSGFLNAHSGPFGEQALERHLTGRWSKPVAAMGGAAAAAGGGTAGAAARSLTAPTKPGDPEADQPAAG